MSARPGFLTSSALLVPAASFAASRAQGTTASTSFDGALSAPTQLLRARTRT